MDRVNSIDRAYGTSIEDEFIQLVTSNGYAAHRLQEDRQKNGAKIHVAGEFVIAPDIATWRPGKSSLHEIKAKYPTSAGEFGLEEYRLRSYQKLAKFVRVNYTIKVSVRPGPNAQRGMDSISKHCWDWIDKWVTVDMRELFDTGKLVTCFPSYVNGVLQPNVPQLFWPIRLWTEIDWVAIGVCKKQPTPSRV